MHRLKQDSQVLERIFPDKLLNEADAFFELLYLLAELLALVESILDLDQLEHLRLGLDEVRAGDGFRLWSSVLLDVG